MGRSLEVFVIKISMLPNNFTSSSPLVPRVQFAVVCRNANRITFLIFHLPTVVAEISMESEESACNKPKAVVRSIQSLSVLVIMYPGKWPSDQFLPNCYSKRIVDWFEGTGTVIGTKRNRVYILSSIHCMPGKKFTFFVKGTLTEHKHVPATLVENYFIAENNGIDVSVFSCDSGHFDAQGLSEIANIEWRCPDSFRIGSPLWLVHYPTSSEPDGAASTHRLFNDCFSTVTEGVLLSEDFKGFTIDSTIIATGGSSGGLIVDENGHVVAVHDSQHDETHDKIPVSTHRMISELRAAFRNNKQLHNLLYN